jgi:hypothetical protein
MLFRKIFAVYFDIRMEYLNILCQKPAFFYILKKVVHIITQGLISEIHCLMFLLLDSGQLEELNGGSNWKGFL